MNPAALDRKQHRNTRVITERGREFGENVHLVPVVGNELRSLVIDYPICLIKDNDTGRFGLSVLLGFEPGENLFLDGNRWDGTYVPLHIRRQPFVVGLAEDANAASPKDSGIIAIDMDSKRVQESRGERLFDDAGEWTPYMKGISGMLSDLMAGIRATDAFIAMLADLDMIESTQLAATFADGEQKRFDGIFMVSEEKLSELREARLEDFHGKGYLQACHLILASIGNLQKLIERKNALNARQADDSHAP